MIKDKIEQFLEDKEIEITDWIKWQMRREVGENAGWAFQRQYLERREWDNKGTIRFSSAGKCVRQQAYKFLGTEEEGMEIGAKAKMIFHTGDGWETTIVMLAKAAGVQIVGTLQNQISIEVPLNDVIVTGHPDGVIFDIDNRESLLFECKSMNSRNFKRFVKNDIDEGYIAQINLYMYKLGLKKCCIVAVNKDTCDISEHIIGMNEALVKQLINDMVTVSKSTEESMPEPKYTANADGIYDWHCLYCAFWGKCHPNAEKVLIKKSWKLKEK